MKQPDPEIVPAELDIQMAKAQLLAVLWRRDPLICARDALVALERRNLELVDETEIRSALRDQFVLLEATATRFLIEAAGKGAPEQRRALAGIAFAAQRLTLATAGALHQLNEEAANARALEANP